MFIGSVESVDVHSKPSVMPPLSKPFCEPRTACTSSSTFMPSSYAVSKSQSIFSRLPSKQPWYGGYTLYWKSPIGRRSELMPRLARNSRSSRVTHVSQCRRICLFASSGPSTLQNENWSIAVSFTSLPRNW